MDKDKPSSTFPKLENLIAECLQRLSLDWHNLTDKEVNLALKKYETLQSDQFIQRINESRVLLEISLEGSCSGPCYLMFSSQNAILISGLILKDTKERIDEYLKGNKLDENYSDTFQEFCKQTSAILDNVLKNNLDEGIHAKFSQLLLPPLDKGRLDESVFGAKDQEIFVANTWFSITDLFKDDLAILFPIDLAEEFYGETIDLAKKRYIGKILVVDDAKADRAVIKTFLRHSDYLVITCADEEAARSFIFREKIDLILLDIYLGDENGLDICKRLKRNMLYESIPIIMYSCGSTKENVVKAIRAGAVDFIAKPFDKELLLRKIKKHMPQKTK